MNKEPSFIITINDRFCTWEFGFDFHQEDGLSIQDVLQPIIKELDGEILYSKLIKKFDENK